MNTLKLATVVALAAVLSLPAVMTGPQVLAADRLPIWLASLNPGVVEAETKMSQMPDGGLEKLLGNPIKKTKPIQLAGKCGSSGYSCTSPGFLYCCGNSTDGFYCAADVNGC